MTGVYILSAVAAILCAATLVVVLLNARRKGKDGATYEDVQRECEKLAAHIDADTRMQNSALAGSINAQIEHTRSLQERTEAIAGANLEKIDQIGKSLMQSLNDFRAEQIDKLAASEKETINQLSLLAQSNAQAMAELRAEQLKGLAELSKEMARQLDIVRQANAQNMTDLRAHNERELEKVRQTVDEKLSATLDKRFDQSFKIVNDRLEEINRTFVELQSLQSGVNDLNKIFKNVKTRGTWGEVALGSLLEQILAPEQFDRQVRIKRGSQEAVDFAIRMPGKGDGEVLLPVDSKFPNEDYERLVIASEGGKSEDVEAATKAIADFIKKQAQSIRDKYINPPRTTDFAIMYLPTEGLYAEVVRNTPLLDELQNKYRVIVCGPTTFAALLNSLQMGFQTLAVEKRSKEIGKLFRAFITDFAKFEELLQKTHQNINTVGNTLTKAEERTALLKKKLDKVYDLTKDDLDELPDGKASTDSDGYYDFNSEGDNES